MNRAELQQLVKDRLRDAKILLAGRRWAGAYYLAGYAVECALKSCVIAYLMRTDLFPEKRYSEQCYTHKLEDLVKLAALKVDFDAALATDPRLEINWDTVKVWSEATRYQRRTQAEALALYRAITDRKQGVLQWFRSRW